MVTTWDTASDAAEFAAAATTAVAALDPDGVVVSDGLLEVFVAMGDRAPDLIGAITR
jgi:hypothetical protein